MIEVILCMIACIITAFVVVRKPKLAIPKGFESVEREIEEWLRNPLIPSGVKPIPAEIPWIYSEFGKPTKTTVGQSAIGSFVASAQQQENQLDMA
jgi:hypothetical protein